MKLNIPASVDQVLADLTQLLEAGDIVIDGANSYYRDDIRRGTELQTRGIREDRRGTGVPRRERCSHQR